jgi:glycosyltransferase involved in cell wall biosynthesis
MIYNMMPDAVIPSVSLRIFGKKILHIFDFEEEVSEDHEAPKIIRMWDLLCRKHMCFDGAILSSSTLRNSIVASTYAIFHGFTPPSEIEFASLSKMASSKAPRDKTRDVVRVSFIGRLDSMRCIIEFLEAISSIAESRMPISVSVVGYCNDPVLLADIESRVTKIGHLVPINLHVSVPREQVLSVLANSDVFVSLVRDERFLERSFPSKLVEYLIFNGVVVSQPVADLAEVDNFIWISSTEVKFIREGILEAVQRVDDAREGTLNGKGWVISNCTIAAGSKRFEEFFKSIEQGAGSH